MKIFEGVFNYIKSDEPLLNNTLKTLQDLENSTTDSIELWNNVAKDAEDAKRDLEEQKKQILEFDQKMKVLGKKLKMTGTA
ncbi:hypothetical protein COJ43_08110 [Bacillus cereus]|nr:hypothetical protein COJ43_08110 [Bacillus cereus]